MKRMMTLTSVLSLGLFGCESIDPQAVSDVVSFVSATRPLLDTLRAFFEIF